jgi:hypothetical protein
MLGSEGVEDMGRTRRRSESFSGTRKNLRFAALGFAHREREGYMETKKFIYYQDEEKFIGWLEDFPDYRTQGETLDELKENLNDICAELTSGSIPNVLHVGELRVA